MHNIIATLVMFLLGLLFIGVSLPLYYKKVKPNYFYGIVRNIYECDSDWYVKNKRGAKKVIVISSVICVISFIPLAIPEFSATTVVIWIVGSCTAIVISLLHTFITEWRTKRSL
ncbi:hypothetical protein [Geomicrobium sp. JCM 19055]|uniref:hypothetical protein n=1 Tax=Geomicrobium sp. JCM 19055 TaxID=1460649 RepID=UPI00045EDAF4|nr:hypothetical protein [Geomicrobium sp. JCM 19055]GAK00127.1 hypothetical protein JCM19055_3199 [Geomicrobium sp. JCM 19055]